MAPQVELGEKRKHQDARQANGIDQLTHLEFIDLTGDSDEEPPTKRQKSTSLSALDASAFSRPTGNNASQPGSRPWNSALLWIDSPPVSEIPLPLRRSAPPHSHDARTTSANVQRSPFTKCPPFTKSPNWTPTLNKSTQRDPQRDDSPQGRVSPAASRTVKRQSTSPIPVNEISPNHHVFAQSTRSRSSSIHSASDQKAVEILSSFYPVSSFDRRPKPSPKSKLTSGHFQHALENRVTPALRNEIVHKNNVSHSSRNDAIDVKIVTVRDLPNQPPPPVLSSQIEVWIHPTAKQLRKKRRTFLKELERGPELTTAKLKELEETFGQNGFSESFSTENDKRILKELAQPRKRRIKRKEVQLDLGLENLSLTETSSLDMIHPQQQNSAILGRRFLELSHPPTKFSNEHDSRHLDGKFQFISDYIFRPGVTTADVRSNHGCDCDGICTSECGCLVKHVDVPGAFDHLGRPVTVRRPIQTFTSSSSNTTVVSESYLDVFSRTLEITECNDRCGCGPECWNRVVQKGRQIPLEIFQTSNKTGFGVRSPQFITRGQFIDVYLGEVITSSQLEAREDAKDEKASSYIYSLDWWNERGVNNYTHYQVDGEHFASAMRFVNHSCDPNGRSFPVQTKHHGDKKVYYLAFFATRDIKANEEITIDYNPQLARDKEGRLHLQGGGVDGGDDGEEEEENEEEDDEILDEDTVLCKCGAKNCRIRLWPRASQRKKRTKRVNRS